YDGENLQASFTDIPSNGSTKATCAYDGQGRRIKRTIGTQTTLYVYDVTGRLIAEYGGAGHAAGTAYLTPDHLGSTRVATDETGAVTARHDYLPFGEEIMASLGGRSPSLGYAVDDDVAQKFTGKERDDESRLDFFGARYYSAAQGRFTS